MTERTDATAAPAPIELAPEPPPKGVRVWMKDNLFSTPASTVLTIVGATIALLFLRGTLGFIIATGRRWDAVTINMRLLFVQAYPTDSFNRIWISIGIIIVLAALSLAVWRVGGMTTLAKLSKGIMGTGGFIAFMALLAMTIDVDETGLTIAVTPTKVVFLVIGLVIFGAGYAIKATAGDRLKDPFIPTLLVVGALVVIVVGLLWVIRLPVPLEGGGGPSEPLPVANTTRVPWTVLAVTGFVAYALGLWLRTLIPEKTGRNILTVAWIATFPVVTMIVLRDPFVDLYGFFAKFGTMISGWDPALYASDPVAGAPTTAEWVTGLLVLTAFVVIGGALIYAISLPRWGEAGRVVAGLLLVAAVLSWVVPMLIAYRILLLLLALFALGAPTFAGEASKRRTYMIAWFIVAPLTIYVLALAEAASQIETPGGSFMGGMMLTFILAIAGIALSFPLGVLLALGRTSSMPIFRLMSVVYIEVVRGVPLITWLIVGAVMLPLFLPVGVELDGILRAILAIAIFSAAYLAENVRGGLQSIPKGQYEAAKALGMTTPQLTIFIVLPQALRAVIPALVGQVIAIFKDTSLVTIIGLFDFLHIARSVIPNQTSPFNNLGTIREALLFAALIYWIITFSISRASLRLEKKLGVGER
jgi:general L-amino acid transport system permease protein